MSGVSWRSVWGKHKAINLTRLRDALYKEREKISQKQINALVAFVPEQMAKCIKNGGLHARY